MTTKEKQALKLALNEDANDTTVSWERSPRIEGRGPRIEGKGRAKTETHEGGSSKPWLSVFPSQHTE